jgi:hypothetical protein
VFPDSRPEYAFLKKLLFSMMSSRNMNSFIRKAILATQEGEELDRFKIEPKNTNVWLVTFPAITFIDDASDLFQDLETYARTCKKNPAVVM